MPIEITYICNDCGAKEKDVLSFPFWLVEQSMIGGKAAYCPKCKDVHLATKLPQFIIDKKFLKRIE